jgi:hypothetical protein
MGQIQRSWANIQKQTISKLKWHNIGKNIYDELTDITYTFRFLGLPLYSHTRQLVVDHTFVTGPVDEVEVKGFRQIDAT